MKKILGLDLGVSSIGMAIISSNNDNEYNIENLSVRIIPEDPNFHGKYYSGLTASKNYSKTIDKGIRRNNQRFKIRRDQLKAILIKENIYPNEELIKLNAIELYGLRAKATKEKVTLAELGRILIHINQRRGFLSNRKSNSEDENSSEYKLKIAQLEGELEGRTIGEQLYKELKEKAHPQQILLRERTYLRKTYMEEFDRIWDCQNAYYPTVLTGNSQEESNRHTLYDIIRNQTIFLQRPLKSQKHLVSNCTFEKGHKSIPKSSPYFEIFRIWQKLNDLEWKTEDGILCKPPLEQKQKLFRSLFYGEELNNKYVLTISKIKAILGYSSRSKIYLNFTELEGSKTFKMISEALSFAKVNKIENYIKFNIEIADEKGGLFELWHILYSISDEKDIINALVKRFNFTEAQSKIIANKVNFKSDFGSLSSRAIKKLLPHLMEGSNYYDSCIKIGYDPSGYKTEIELRSKLAPLFKNSLRNPVVEQILNQLVNMVNLAIDKYGQFDEIRVELARELRNSAKTRQNITKSNTLNKKINQEIRLKLQTPEYGYSIVNGRDIKRYKLWEETNHQCLYCSKCIGISNLKNGDAEIEHIIPKSRSFNDSLSNFIIAHRTCNSGKEGKNQLTAYDFMQSKGEEALHQYIEKINALYADGKGKISKAKFENLLCKGEDIPSDFVQRMLKDSQYISKEAVKLLKTVCPKVYTTTGQITDFLRSEWQLNQLLQELMFDKYKAAQLTKIKTIKQGNGETKDIEIIDNWTKRDDHRHHAVDALICALTDQKIILKLNNLNKIYQYERDALSEEDLSNFENEFEDKFSLKQFIEQSHSRIKCPITNLRKESKDHLENIFISIKKSNSKVLTPNVVEEQNKVFWTPRGRLHEETIMGQIKIVDSKLRKIDENFNELENIVNPKVKEILKQHLEKFDNNSSLAFSKKNLKNTPLLYKNKEINEVQVYKKVLTKRVQLTGNITPAQIDKIIDKKIKDIVIDKINPKDRNDIKKDEIKKAFNSPTWLNENKQISINSVTVIDESKTEKIRSGYAITGNNHHALIYKDENGKLNEQVVSFYEAVNIGLLNINQTGKPYPIINRCNHSELGNFLFSMQINDLFVFDLVHSETPQAENEIDFFDKVNRKLLSEKLFRLQKMSKNKKGQFLIYFLHHLETSTTRNSLNLKAISWEAITKNSDLYRLTKIRLNHLGDIIKIGE